MIDPGPDRLYRPMIIAVSLPRDAWENKPRRKRADLGSKQGCSYGVPEGAPAICQENARNEEAVKSIAGSTVE